MSPQNQKWIGIDLHNNNINVHINPGDEKFQFDNSQQGINKLMNKLIPIQPNFIILKRAQGEEASIVTKLILGAFPAIVIHSDNAKRLMIEADIDSSNSNINAQDLAALGPYIKSKTVKFSKQIRSQLNSLSVLDTQLKEMIQEDKLELETITDASKGSLTKHISWLEEQLSDNNKQLKVLIDKIENQQQVTVEQIEQESIKSDPPAQNKKVTKYYRGQAYQEERTTVNTISQTHSQSQSIPTKKITKHYRGQSYEVEVPDYAAWERIKRERASNN